jgi:ATP-dependent RNA helicase DDX24/MAK5
VCLGSRASPTTRLRPTITNHLQPTTTKTDDEREGALYYLLARHPGRALVFVNAVSALRRVAAVLKLLGLPAQALHAQQQQRQRLKALDRFKANENGVLVATDVAARGDRRGLVAARALLHLRWIVFLLPDCFTTLRLTHTPTTHAKRTYPPPPGLDVRGVATVVHYQVPASADTYIHRCGRTARTGGADGLAVTLVSPPEAARWAALMRALGRLESPPARFPVERAVLKQAVQRVALAQKVCVWGGLSVLAAAALCL